jgi:hypothetical protein
MSPTGKTPILHKPVLSVGEDDVNDVANVVFELSLQCRYHFVVVARLKQGTRSYRRLLGLGRKKWTRLLFFAMEKHSGLFARNCSNLENSFLQN